MIEHNSPEISAKRSRTITETHEPIVQISNLSISFRGRHLVTGVNLTINPGQCVALVGESGSGKSLTARSLLGLAGEGAEVEASQLEIQGQNVLKFSAKQWHNVRGTTVGLVLQDALVSLDPVRTIGTEVSATLVAHGLGQRQEYRQKVINLLTRVGIPEPALRIKQLPHELSGGLRQRALIAAAIAGNPAILIADEPTTALDTTVQKRVLDLLITLKNAGTAILLITHDLSVVAHIADSIAVMKSGQIVESGVAQDVLEKPQHPYTQTLIAAIPAAHKKGTRLSHQPQNIFNRTESTQYKTHSSVTPILEVHNITKRYRGVDKIIRTVVDDVSFTIDSGATLGIVGESGSGKSTIASIVLGLNQPDTGTVLLDGHHWSELSEKKRRPQRRRIAMVYQDPLSSFDPRYTVGKIIASALPVDTKKNHRQERVRELLDQVGLPVNNIDRKPLYLSGGQRQRVAIARAIASQPDLIVFDEPVAALDVSIQAQILDLLTDIQAGLATSYLFISHDLGVIRHISDDVLVLQHGRVVETGPVEDIFHHPQAAYTQELFQSILVKV